MDISPPFWSLSGIKAFLFDWDGVVAETHLDFSPLRNRYYSGRRAMLLEEAHTLSESEQSALMRDLYALEMAGADKATPVAGIFEVFNHLEESGIPWGIVSRNCLDSIELAAEKIGIPLPSYVGSRDDPFVKPDPRALWDAASALYCPPSECAFVGDFIYDMVGARRAGMRGILVQRHEPEWSDWYDVAFPAVMDLLAALRTPKGMIPWEYRDLVTTRGEEWLERAFLLSACLPSGGRACSPEWLCALASLGAGCFVVHEEATLTPQLCRLHPTWNHVHMGEPLAFVIRDFLKTRYPLVRVSEEYVAADAQTFPANPQALLQAVEKTLHAY